MQGTIQYYSSCEVHGIIATKWMASCQIHRELNDLVAYGDEYELRIPNICQKKPQSCLIISAMELVGTDFPAERRSNLDNTNLSEVHSVSRGRLHDALDPCTPPLCRISLHHCTAVEAVCRHASPRMMMISSDKGTFSRANTASRSSRPGIPPRCNGLIMASAMARCFSKVITRPEALRACNTCS